MIARQGAFDEGIEPRVIESVPPRDGGFAGSKIGFHAAGEGVGNGRGGRLVIRSYRATREQREAETRG